MFRRILLFMMTLFTLITVNAVSDEYDYTLFQEDESGDYLVEIEEDPSSCSTIYDLFPGEEVTMTPVFGCAFGYKPIDPDNIYGTETNFCELDVKECPAGYYLYANESENIFKCMSCPRESYCAGGEYNIFTAGTGINKCPEGTTTSATPDTGRNAQFIEQCSWYKCKPGQQLKVTGEVASCEECDAGKYCVGGVYDKAHADNSMQDCPTKTYAGNVSSEPGSFRCSYTCPAGKAMEVIGAWYRADSDCVPCPKGYYCPGDISSPAPDHVQSYFTPTVYTDGMNTGEGIGTGYHGAIQCEEGKTTLGLESKSASECTPEHYCEPGKYWDITNPHCVSCSEVTTDDFRADLRATLNMDLVYCPGGYFTDIANANTPNKVGIYLCPQYIVKEKNANNEWVEVFNPDTVDPSSSYYEYSSKYKATNNRTQCDCPRGYDWRSDTQTCCGERDFCCPRGMEIYTAKNGSQMCQTCEQNKYCPGTILSISCIPGDNQYYASSTDTCEECPAGAEPNESHSECVCKRELLADIYPNEPSDGEPVREWNSESNNCGLVKYNLSVVRVLRNSGDDNTASHYTISTRQYTYADDPFDIEAQQYAGYNFVGWCKDSPDCDPRILSDIVTVDPKNVDDRKKHLMLYAIYNSDSFSCASGYYLDLLSPEGCSICPKGGYCPGGTNLSVYEIGQKNCPKGTYNPNEGASSIDDCISCQTGVEAALGVDVRDNNLNLTTLGTHSEFILRCGYNCTVGYYDDAVNDIFACSSKCPAGYSCPGKGLDTEQNRLVEFIPYYSGGQGKFPCPEGLTSEEGSGYCYIHCDPTYYAKQDSDGVYKCVPCDGNIPVERRYYYCPGGNLKFYVTEGDGGLGYKYSASEGKLRCESSKISNEPASECYEGYTPGVFVNEYGYVGECWLNSFCPGGTSQGMIQCPLGSVSNPGSESVFDCKCLSDTDLEEGVSAQHRPNDVYAEKGAGLYKVANNEYVCANTYLVVDDGTSYENPGINGEIPGAGARVVACKWDGTQEEGVYDKCTDKAMRVCDKDIWTDSETGLMSDNVSTTDVLNTLADTFGMTLSGDNIFNNTAVSSIAGITTVGDNCQSIICPVEYNHPDGNNCYAKVGFDTNGGTPEPDSYRVFYDGENTTYRLLELPDVALNGYSLVGWYDNAELIGDAVTTETELSGDKTLYAKWNAEVYSITYHGIADANVSGNPDSYTIESADIILNNPTKEDYEFLGWCDNEGLSEDCLTEKIISLGSTGNKEFWAKWQEIETCSADFPKGVFGDCYATITYENMFGATLPVGVSNPDIYTAEMVAEHSIQLPVPTKTGYEFLGWYDNSGFMGAPVENIPVGSTGNKKYWAKWQAPECESGKYLHIGDNAICLYETKPTSPALVVKTGDTKYYAHMCTDCDKTMNGATGSKLHIRYNNKTYNVYDLTAQ